MIKFIKPDYNLITLDTNIYLDCCFRYSEEYRNYKLGLCPEPNIEGYLSNIIRNRENVSVETVVKEFGYLKDSFILENRLNKEAVINIFNFIKSKRRIKMSSEYNNSLGVDLKEKNDNAIAITCGTNGIGNLATCNKPDFVKAFKRIGMPKTYRLIKVMRGLNKSFLVKNWWNLSESLAAKIIRLYESLKNYIM